MVPGSTTVAGKAPHSARWMLAVRRASAGVQRFSALLRRSASTPPGARCAAQAAKNSRV